MSCCYSKADSRLPKITPHTFRRTYTALMVAADVPLRKIQREMGHTTSSMTMDIYNQKEIDPAAARALLALEKATIGQIPVTEPVMP